MGTRSPPIMLDFDFSKSFAWKSCQSHRQYGSGIIGVTGRGLNSSEVFESVISTAAKNIGVNGEACQKAGFKLTTRNQIPKDAKKSVVKKAAKKARAKTKADVVMQAERDIEMKI